MNSKISKNEKGNSNTKREQAPLSLTQKKKQKQKQKQQTNKQTNKQT